MTDNGVGDVPSTSDASATSETTISTRPPLLGHRPALDGIRGLGVIIVMTGHIQERLFPTSDVLAGTYSTVYIFFVLSGFLITKLLLEEYDGRSTISLTAFYRRRILRLWPALWILVGTDLLYTLWTRGSWPAPVLQALGLTAVQAGNFAAAMHLPMGNLGPLWTLGVEEQFYLVWPLALLLLLRSRFRFAIPTAILGALVVWHFVASAHSNTLFTALDPGPVASIGLGALVGWAFHAGYQAPPWFRHLQFLVGPALIYVLLIYWGTQPSWFNPYLLYLVAIAAALMIVIVIEPGTGMYRVLSLRAFLWLGKLSYSLYLWHFIMISLVLEVFPTANPWLDAGLAAPLAFVTAIPSYYLVERPFVRYAHGRPLSWRRRAASAATTA